MGIMVDPERGVKDILKEYIFYIPHTEESLKFIESIGYQKCSGSNASWRDLKSIAVQPFTKKWWTDTYPPDFTIERRVLNHYYIKKGGIDDKGGEARPDSESST